MEHIQVFFQVIGIWILKASSEPIFLEYHFIDQPMSWAEAQSYCRIKHSDLATVRHMKDHAHIYSRLEMSGAHSSWVGLRKTEMHQWRWSDGSGTLQPEYLGWSMHQPDNSGGSEWCAEMSSDGTWNDGPCNGLNGYVCYELNGDNQVRFARYNTLTDWRSAQNTCRRNHVDLVTVGSSEINSAIKDLVLAGQKAWIGLFSDGWEWSDGSDTSYRFWTEGDDGEGSCAALQLDGSMTSADCMEEKPFFCEGGLKRKKTLLKITLLTTADLSSEHIFKIKRHMNQQLKANGVSDFKLNWKREKKNVFHREKAPDGNKDTCENV